MREACWRVTTRFRQFRPAGQQFGSSYFGACAACWATTARREWPPTPSEAWYLGNLSANDARVTQGMGVLDVDAAWQALVESKASAPFEITGHGLYKRFAFVGQRDLTETLTLTRTTGPSRPVEYSVRLRGAPSGYEVPPRVPLPLNVPVTSAVPGFTEAMPDPKAPIAKSITK